MAAALRSCDAGAVIAPATDAFRQGMRRLAGACSVITTADADGGRESWAGFTATAVMSVTADPPRLLVSVNRSVWAHRLIAEGGRIGVNVLGEDLAAIARRFAGGQCPPQEKFAQGKWAVAVTGAPLLEDALVALDCRVAHVIHESTHDLFVCDVVAVSTRERHGDPLVYFEGAFSTERRATATPNEPREKDV